MHMDTSTHAANRLSGQIPSNEPFTLLEKISKAHFEPYSETQQRDLDLIDKHAESLNREAVDVLDYQVIP
uniref:Uncharacterized protein n=1 Tax=Candidatus Kentrum eta TaxID=2126337 RepID=A0A450V924_9GAMM|nr:MAG: hypothetical protein BECKH772A_GA0070896_102164 [Candidatus Kentron sp. H]VFK01246.1 MAG: hypothetical protein BECKH772B_GA0070898_102234 [Candidatus Kentron sp. H]VFK04885.1 MAG: hypothetical protein BECKH772C_GA0070978_102174 [Candidatus Kentron sp. H]